MRIIRFSISLADFLRANPSSALILLPSLPVCPHHSLLEGRGGGGGGERLEEEEGRGG